MRKIMLSAGLAFSVTGVVFAGERSRGTTGDAMTGGTADALAPTVAEVAPGVVKMSLGSLELQARANNAVYASEVIQEYGSLDRFAFEAGVMGVQGGKRSGVTVFANNAQGFFSDLMDPNAPIKPAVTTAEEYKSQRSWTESVYGGQTVTMFVDGAVFNDGSLSAEPEWARHQATMASAQSGNGNIFADGATFDGH